MSQFFINYERAGNEELNHLQEIIISAFVEQIARKISVKNENGVMKEVYESSEGIFDYLHISPQSYLFAKRPEYVCYTNILETKKYIYITKVHLLFCML